jgi:CheY-like chemotaxis protein
MPIAKVLLVDDEPDLRRIGQLSLERVGRFEVVVAASGAQALEVAARERPDAILLDVMMPELDGPGTFALLRGHERTRDIPVVFMTAKAQAHEVARLRSLGARGVISKPFDPMALPADLRRIVEGGGAGPR